jgi:predicted nucleotidyltransferase
MKNQKLFSKRQFSAAKKKLREDEDVLFSYLFGSYAASKENEMSDIDIAIYLKEADISFYLKKERQLADELISIFETEKVDLIILNVVPTLLKYRIIRDSTLLNSRDEIRRVNFETEVMLRYFDLRPHLEEYDKELHARIKAEAI